MEIKINLNEEKITAMVEEMIAKEIFDDYRGLNHGARFCENSN